LGETSGPNGGKLVLLVDFDAASRWQARHVLELRGMDVVQASNGMAALELVQRLPRSFALVITDLDLPGIPGAALVETLRIFRPDLPVLCMSAQLTPAGGSLIRQCLSKPVQGGELEAALEELANGWQPEGLLKISDTTVARVRARFAVVGDLVEAALEICRGAEGDD
jgi:two-component system, cell cycle response regulator CpdR